MLELMNTFCEEACTCIAVIHPHCIVITTFILHNILVGHRYYHMSRGPINHRIDVKTSRMCSASKIQGELETEMKLDDVLKASGI
jgi:hypothetical protein